MDAYFLRPRSRNRPCITPGLVREIPWHSAVGVPIPDVPSYADGVLTLTIPVAEEAKPRRIEIHHGTGQTAIGTGSSAPEPATA